jgi:glucose-1-phosphate thymidylyltransferase
MSMDSDHLIGIIPAGGLGKRMYPFKLWKELIPIGYKKVSLKEEEKIIPKLLAEYTLENMVNGGVKNVIFIINSYKTEIMRIFGYGSNYNVNIAYLNQELESGFYAMPIAIDMAYPFTKDKIVFMGMPDTVVRPDYCFKQLLEKHLDKNADLTLGVFPTDNPTRLAPVVINSNDEVEVIHDKPKVTKIYNTWNIAVWSSKFTDLLHTETKKYMSDEKSKGNELLMSDLFNKAIQNGLKVCAVFFKEGKCDDLGKIEEFIDTQKVLEAELLGVINI